jgi:hypothetical protein
MIRTRSFGSEARRRAKRARLPIRGTHESTLSEGTREATEAAERSDAPAGVDPGTDTETETETDSIQDFKMRISDLRTLSRSFCRRARRAKGFVARAARRRQMVPACGRQITAYRGPQQTPESAASSERRRRDADLWAATRPAAPRGIGVQRRFRDRAAGGPGVAMSDGGEEGLAWWPSRRCRRAKRGIQVRRRRDSMLGRGGGISVECRVLSFEF